MTLLPGISSLTAATNELLKAAAMNSSPVFISGEVGTEKSFAAKLIHQMSDRAIRPLNKINVSWKLPPDLRQYFEASKGGTVVLNLQKEFPIDMQYTLVELASHGSFTDPMTGEQVDADVRIILLTSQTLDDFAGRSELLPELRELLESQHIVIPPLRSRPEDIPALVRYATTRARETGRSKSSGADPQVLSLFRQWGWPGNAEDLLLVTAQAAIACKAELIALDDLPESFLRQVPPELLEAARQVSSPRPHRLTSSRNTPLPIAGGHAEQQAAEDQPLSGALDSSEQVNTAAMQQMPTPLPTARDTQASDLTEEEKKLPPRVLQLARRLNAQSQVLSRQLSGPLDSGGSKALLQDLAKHSNDAEALEALERELDRGLEMVLTMRRQMALLNLRQQQSAETIRDLVQRISEGHAERGEDGSVVTDAKQLAESLQAMETIISRVSTEVPMLGSHIQATLSGQASDQPINRSTPSGIFRRSGKS
ncbi:hypothetical protein GC173_12000 [bacterium]|nr:hypothetical protein [bacterium]